VIVFLAAPVIRTVARMLLPSTRQPMIWARFSVLSLFICLVYCNSQYKCENDHECVAGCSTILLMPKEQVLQIRLSSEEKQGFQAAAGLAGIPLSSWVRERLRLAAIRDLEGAGQKIPFIPPLPLGESDGRE
jgi:hypothetical protein